MGEVFRFDMEKWAATFGSEPTSVESTHVVTITQKSTLLAAITYAPRDTVWVGTVVVWTRGQSAYGRQKDAGELRMREGDLITPAAGV